MNFNFNITVPHGTSIDNPFKYEMNLGKGVIYDLKLSSTAGCGGEVFCYITDIFNNSIFPNNQEGVYQLWGGTIESKFPSCKYELTGDNMTMYFKGYSPNAVYDHMINVSIWVVSNEDLPYLLSANKHEFSNSLKGFINGFKNIPNSIKGLILGGTNNG